MSKHKSKKPQSGAQFPESRESHKKINLVTIETASSSPIQEVMCREEYKELFEGLCKRKQ